MKEICGINFYTRKEKEDKNVNAIAGFKFDCYRKDLSNKGGEWSIKHAVRQR